MLRRGLLVAAALVLILGAAALATGLVGRSLVFMAWGAFLVAAITFERITYKQLASKSPGPGWERTTERFVDEETGRMVTVYIQPETGERVYVKD